MVSILISPLELLIKDVITALNKCKYPSIHVTPTTLTNGTAKAIIASQKEPVSIFLLCSPEVLKLTSFRKLVANLEISQISVDEAHVSADWGESFRTDYSSIHEVREYLNCPLALFSATLSKEKLPTIIKNTGIRTANLKFVTGSPDRYS